MNRVYNHKLKRNNQIKLQVDNEAVTLPWRATGLTVHSEGRRGALLTTDFGLKVSFDGRSQVEIKVPGQLAGTCICLLCHMVLRIIVNKKEPLSAIRTFQLVDTCL